MLAGNIIFLFYYSHLNPLHVDEAGFWFNWTNKSILNRFYNDNVSLGMYPPFHGLTIYLAKISIYIFGNTGIGLRLPVIIFGVFSSWLLYFFTKKITGRTEVAILAATFLFLNPFFSHYSHELRGYSSLIFFSLCSYFYLFKLIKVVKNLSYWCFLFFSFLGCYLSNLACPIFFAVFLATIFILKSYKTFYPTKDKLIPLENLTYSGLFVFSFIAASFFSYLLFVFDASYLRVMQDLSVLYQKAHGGQLSNLIAIPDFFSAFLGYKYLDDPASEIYHYPTYIWLFSLICFLVGFIQSIRTKEFFAIFFFVILVLTSFFYAFSGSHIYTRSAVFLMPFLIIYQAVGIFILVEFIISLFSDKETVVKKIYWVLPGFIFLYFALLHFGKYEKLDGSSDNPYELARDYLKNNSGPNDLIISSVQDTTTGFYFGKMIRNKYKNIYKNEKINAIYFIDNNSLMDSIELKDVLNKKQKVFNLRKFKISSVFSSQSLVKTRIIIYKIKILSNIKLELSNKEFFGAQFLNDAVCKKTINNQGMRLNCESNTFACSDQIINFPAISKQHYQIVFLKFNSDHGTNFLNLALLNHPKIMTRGNIYIDSNSIFKNIYQINRLTDSDRDIDVYSRNNLNISPSIERLRNGKNLVLCLWGNLFNDNVSLQGIKIISFEIEPL